MYKTIGTGFSGHVEVTGTGTKSDPKTLSYQLSKELYDKFKASEFVAMTGAFYLKAINAEKSFAVFNSKIEVGTDNFSSTIAITSIQEDQKREQSQTASLTLGGQFSYVKEKDGYWIWIDTNPLVESVNCDQLAEVTFDTDSIDFK